MAAIVAGVTDERLILAIGRLERALARAEAAARAPRSGLPPASAPDAALAERHESLRARTAEAILRLDALIGDAR